MGSCQNYGPFLGTLNKRCRIIIGTQKGTIILTTTHIALRIHVATGGFGLQLEFAESLVLACSIIPHHTSGHPESPIPLN